MTPEQVTLIKDSWDQVVPIQDTAAKLFYDKLFETYPEVKLYFKGDISVQGRKLMTMINTAVNGLENLGALVPAVMEMGARHAGYGVKDEDYGKVAVCLLWTLEQGLGEAFTDEVKEAWTTMYTTVAEVMKQGAREASVA
jgi:hemoglobin-like flavoprotein